MVADGLYPPHSRLFVACSKDTTEEELTKVFQEHGTVVNINLCRDRVSGAAKGFAFIQFEKTSEAAAAIEALNGTVIGSSERPIKVTVALSKDQSASNASTDNSQFERLFLVVPKTATEEELKEYFKTFGEIEFVTIVKNRETNESKGYAYVKYKSFSDAARAFENCDSSYKVVFAKPKESKSRPMEVRKRDTSYGSYREGAVCTHLDNNPSGYTCLRAMVSTELSEEEVEWLFDIPPGLDYVRFFPEPSYRNYETSYARKVLVQYDSPGTAAYALRKLDGFEYPRGERLVIKPEYSYPDRLIPSSEKRRPGGTSKVHLDLMKQVETLTRSLGEANQLLQAAGVKTPLGRSQSESFRCSANLPPPQPLAPPDSPCEERLFLVCEPGLPPQDALWDVFGRFGNLIELYILNGKNCGYAKYANKDSAVKAMQALNGEDLYRMRMKVLIAEPQPKDGERKRPRLN